MPMLSKSLSQKGLIMQDWTRPNLTLTLLADGEGDLRSCLESFLHDIHTYELFIGDMGGMTPDDHKVAKEFGSWGHPMPTKDRAAARNMLLDDATRGHIVHIEPWERLVSGSLTAIQVDYSRYSFQIFQSNALTHQTRVWPNANFPTNLPVRYANPVFETNGLTGGPIIATVASHPPNRGKQDLLLVNEWIDKCPLLPDPYYYRACLLLGEGRNDEFIVAADRYLFMEQSPKAIMNITLTRYYLGMAHLLRRDAKQVIANAVACLAAHPIMAEFWCLIGDAYYHVMHAYDQAVAFYENALVLGARRLSDDGWPMDFPKYRSYPEKMIASCRDLISGSKYVEVMGKKSLQVHGRSP